MNTAQVQFESARAHRYDPHKVLKVARVVEKSDDETSVIDADWGEEQTFVGTYVEILDPDSGQVKYGSGYQEWVNTNARWDGVENGWYKCTPVDAYQADSEGELVTVLASGVVETTKHVNVGDWLVRQRDGEVMCISAGKFPVLYDVTTCRPLPQD